MPADPRAHVRIVEGITVKPGDRVLLTVADLTAERAQGLIDALREQFPDVIFVVVGDAQVMKVETADTAPTPENLDGCALGPFVQHEDGRYCGYHNRLAIWLVDGNTQCLRSHDA